MSKKMFHKYTLTELLYEGVLDEGMKDFFEDTIFPGQEYYSDEKLNDLYSPKQAAKRKQNHLDKIEAERKKMAADQEAQRKIDIRARLIEKGLKGGKNIEMKEAWMNIREYGIHSDTFRDHFMGAGTKLTPEEISDQLLACGRVKQMCEKAETFAKASIFGMGFVLSWIGSGLAALLGIGNKTIAAISSAYGFASGPLVGDFKDMEEAAGGKYFDKSSKISVQKFFGFDAEVCLQLTEAEITDIFTPDDGDILGGVKSRQIVTVDGQKRRSSKPVSGVHEQLIWMVNASEREYKEDIESMDAEGLLNFTKDMMTMQEFQTWLMVTLKGPYEARRYAEKKPQYPFIDWIGIEKDLKKFGAQYRTGWDKWLGSWDYWPFEWTKKQYDAIIKGLDKEDISATGEVKDAIVASEIIELMNRAEAEGFDFIDQVEEQERLKVAVKLLKDKNKGRTTFARFVRDHFDGDFGKALADAGLTNPEWKKLTTAEKAEINKAVKNYVDQKAKAKE